MAIFPGLGRFKEFWCQKVLPLVYDDSLSFYEVLCKLKSKLNEVIDTLNKQGEYIETQLPILVDETVRKYFNQNQNLPIIDCYAHGITEKLSDIGPALQALINQYGTSYAYYMRGKFNYKLNSPISLPVGCVFTCDGDILSTFNGKINLANDISFSCQGLLASADNAYILGGSGEDITLDIKFIGGFLEVFYGGSNFTNCNFDINGITGGNVFTNDVTLSQCILTIGELKQNLATFGNVKINGCTILMPKVHSLNLVLGNNNIFTTNSIMNNITAGNNNNLTFPSNLPNAIINIQPFSQINGNVKFGGSSDMQGIVSLYGNRFFGKAIQDHHYSTATGMLIPPWGVSQISLTTNNFSTTLGDNFLLTGFHGIVHAVANITNCQVLFPRFGDSPVTMVATQGTTMIGNIGLILESDHYYFINCVPNAHRIFAYDLTTGTIAKDFGPPVQTFKMEEDDGTLYYSYKKWENEYANATTNSDPDTGTGD